MPGFIARRLCPELIFVPVDFKKYTHYSELTRKGNISFSKAGWVDNLFLLADHYLWTSFSASFSEVWPRLYCHKFGWGLPRYYQGLPGKRPPLCHSKSFIGKISLLAFYFLSNDSLLYIEDSRRTQNCCLWRDWPYLQCWSCFKPLTCQGLSSWTFICYVTFLFHNGGISNLHGEAICWWLLSIVWRFFWLHIPLSTCYLFSFLLT